MSPEAQEAREELAAATARWRQASDARLAAEDRLAALERACAHHWGEPVELEPLVLLDYRERRRWERSCLECGRRQVTGRCRPGAAVPEWGEP